jgi:lipopolysaccharide biosynthesis protein
VLKLHSKKSPHRKDGESWRDKIVESLLPENKSLIRDVCKILENKDTAIVGPQGEYVSFLVNFTSTSHHVKKLSKKIIDIELAENLVSVSDEYGFFAGTMFWSRIDALMPVINNVSPSDFEPELGQVDSTLAHALERLFNVIPEIQKKKIYELDQEGVCRIDYHTTNIPEWSEVALDK